MGDIYDPCSDDHIYVCHACGKTSRTQAPTKNSDHGWDASCMLNCILCYADKRPGKDGVIMWHAVQSEVSN